MFTLKKLMFIFGLKSVTKVDSALPGGVQRHLWPWSNTHVFRNLRSRGIFSTHWNVDFYKICWPLELNNALEESIALQRASLFCLLSKKIAEMRGIVGMICIHKKTLICSHFNYKRSLAKGRRKIYKKIGLGADHKFSCTIIIIPPSWHCDCKLEAAGSEKSQQSQSFLQSGDKLLLVCIYTSAFQNSFV